MPQAQQGEETPIVMQFPPTFSKMHCHGSKSNNKTFLSTLALGCPVLPRMQPLNYIAFGESEASTGTKSHPNYINKTLHLWRRLSAKAREKEEDKDKRSAVGTFGSPEELS